MKYQNIKILKWNLFNNIPIKAGITTRNGGFSLPPYNSFNLASHTGDNLEHIIKNRKILTDYLGLSLNAYTSASQIHGDDIVVISKDNVGDKNLTCDGLITTSSYPLLNIFVADCVPIVLYDNKNRVGAVCHCGWKGTYKSLLPKMILKMIKEYNSKAQDILIGIGPSIGSCCYNVSEELYFKFNPDSDEGYIKNNNFYLDLKMINYNQAIKSGVLSNNIEIMNYCTSCSNDLFYSYRKEGESSGRFSCYLNIIS